MKRREKRREERMSKKERKKRIPERAKDAGDWCIGWQKDFTTLLLYRPNFLVDALVGPLRLFPPPLSFLSRSSGKSERGCGRARRFHPINFMIKLNCQSPIDGFIYRLNLQQVNWSLWLSRQLTLYSTQTWGGLNMCPPDRKGGPMVRS